MLVSEYPEMLTGTVKCSSFVLLTLDIAASIRGVTDETAIREAEALPRAKCLAWIYMPVSRLGSQLPHWAFFLVSRGLPAPPHSFAAVPVAPNTAHPETGRPAVHASRPLPWPDCFIHTLDEVTVPISRLYEPLDSGIALDNTQSDAFLLAYYDDMDATAEERLAFAIEAGIAIPVDAHGQCDCFGTCSCSSHESASGSGASSRRFTGDEASEQAPASRAASDCSSSSDRSSSVRGALAAHLSAPDAEPEIEDQGIVLHVQVSGILDPSVDFGTVEDFLAVRGRLAGIEEDRAERAVTAHLSRTAAPKTTTWLQGVSTAGELEDAIPDDALHSSVLEDEPPVQEPPAAVEAAQGSIVSPEAEDEPHSPVHRPECSSKRASSGPDRGSPTPLPPPSPLGPSPTEVHVGPSAPQPPVEVSASSPERAPSPSYSPSTAQTQPQIPDSNAAAKAAKDREGVEVVPSESLPAADPAKAAAGSSATLRFLLSLVISRIRALIARCRAFF